MATHSTAVTPARIGDRSGWRPVIQQAAIFLLYCAIVIGYQWLSQAYTSPFGAYPDEPAHFMTGVMIHDYLLSGFHQSPLKFAQTFYVHYPAIAFGMWGPSFHFLVAIWMLLFSVSRISILILVAIIAAAFAWSTQWFIGRSFDRWTGYLAGLAICLTPAFQSFSVMVMADLLTGTFIFWAGYCWIRYLETGRSSLSLRFGLLATLALLTKANAGCLALVPIPAALLAGRADLIRRRQFWIPAILAVVFAGPWYVLYTWLVLNVSAIPVTPKIAYQYLIQILGVLGWITIPLVLAGMASGFFSTPQRAEARAIWATATSISVSFIVYYCITPGGFEPRYALMSAPWIVYLFVAGVQWAVSAVLPSQRRIFAAAFMVLIVVYGAVTFQIHPKTLLPYAEVAHDLLSQRELPQTAFLVSSVATPEPVMVAEFALRDHRPNHFVLRASKLLARMNWNGDRYENKIPNEAALAEILGGLGVKFVIIDTAPEIKPRPDHVQLRHFVSTDRNWRLIHQYRETQDGPSVEVYEFQGAVKLPDQIAVDVPFTLRKTLSAPTQH